MIVRLIIACFLPALLIALLGGPSRSFAGEARIAVSPLNVTVAPNQEFSVDYTVEGASNVGGYTVTVRWTPDVLEMVSLADTALVNSGDAVVLCGAAQIDNAAGVASVFCTTIFALGPGVDITTPAAVARSTFRAQNAGTTSIGIGESTVSDTANVQITASTVDASVTVSAPAAPTAANASATAVPSATAPAAVATSTPALAGAVSGTATIVREPSSTIRPEATLSVVEAPNAGDGADGDGGVAWWIPAMAAGAAMLLSGGGYLLWRRQT